MIPKEFDIIGKEDIEAIVTNAVSEGRSIEYKQQLPGGTDDDKREFLADASSFANAGGGDMIFGVCDKRDANGKTTGIPDAADGLAGINADAGIRRLEEILRTGIDPRIPGVRLKHIDGFAAGPVIIVRIPKSWASPHMVTFKGQSRFYSRTSAGKHQLDVREIRSAFVDSENLSQRMTAFRADRIAKLLAEEGPLRLEPNPKLILHLLPLRTFGEATAVDFKAMQLLSTQAFQPMGLPDRYGPTFNFDGYMVSADSGSPPSCDSYVQLFRNGTIEAVWTSFTRDKVLLIGALEREILEAVPRYLKLLRNLGIEPPLFVAVSLVGIKGLLINLSDGIRWRHVSRPIDRDVLLLPETLIEEPGSNISELLRPTLDPIWQASGWPCSQGYDGNGKRRKVVDYG